MKSILISIRPEWVAKILNGEKTIEIRKTAPKCDLPIDVYVYCTKAKNKRKFAKIIPPFVARKMEEAAKTLEENGCPKPYRMIIGRHCFSDGKVVAKFTLNKIENFINGMNELEREWDGKPDAEYDYFAYEKALEKACLTYEEANKYCPDQSFYAWHISDLKIFDEPIPLAALGAESAPQSWAYIESDREPIYARNGKCEAYCDGRLIGGNYILHITMNGSDIMHQKWAVMPTKAQAQEILSALNPEGI